MYKALKQAVRTISPKGYQTLCNIKDFVSPPPRTWGKPWDAHPPFDKEEPSIAALLPYIPKHITTVLDVGCSSGRNMLSYNGIYKLWGIDIAPYERMKWVKDFVNFTYEQKTIQQLTEELEQGKYDLTHTLVHTHSVLGYTPAQWQRRFYGALMVAGCKNLHFEEYPPQMTDVLPFALDEKQFVNKSWRKELHHPVAHYRFDYMTDIPLAQKEADEMFPGLIR